jgi:hypothetical protein
MNEVINYETRYDLLPGPAGAETSDVRELVCRENKDRMGARERHRSCNAGAWRAKVARLSRSGLGGLVCDGDGVT